MSAEWDELRTELLKRLWVAGETARTIAERLGGGVTRNAVIGKAHRLGLTGRGLRREARRAAGPPQRLPRAGLADAGWHGRTALLGDGSPV